jgi:phosphate transport system permease protein
MSAATVDEASDLPDADSTSLSSGPRTLEVVWDRTFRWSAIGCAWLAVALMLYILWVIAGTAVPAMKEHGIGFLTGTTWDANKWQFGILPEIWGTLYSSLIALAIGGFFGVAIAIFLTQDFIPPKVEVVFKNIIELLAAIPSVVYGLWGMVVVIPLLRAPCGWLHEHLGWFPLFGGRALNGPAMLPAALVLAIMILPTVTAISRDALSSVPHKLKEAAFGLGATRWEAILGVILPTASGGVFGALVLGLGRALGETMALAMLVGNNNELSVSLFMPANTLASLLALNFPEAGEKETPILMYAAVVLMAITLVVNVFGTAVLNRATAALTGGGDKK